VSDRARADGFWARRGVALAYLLAVLLSLPSLRGPLFGDDFLQRLVLEGALPELGLDATTLYDFSRGGMSVLIERGFVPWHTHPDAAFRFFRPLGSLSIALDQVLFGRAALAGHLLNLGLFLALVAAAIALFRRLLTPNRAGLAAVLFSAAGGHTLNLSWVAGRHGLVGGLLAAVAILLHVERRQSGDAHKANLLCAGTFLSLLLALLSSETALAALVFIVGYELIDRGDAAKARLLAAAPFVAMGLGYLTFYATLGYGVKHSALYLSPLSDPIAYLAGALTRFPALVGEMAHGFPSFLWGRSEDVRAPLAVVGGGFATLVGFLALRASPTPPERRRIGFLGFAALVGSLPMAGGVVDGRMLVVPFLASVPIVATAVDGGWSLARSLPRRPLLAVLAAGVLSLQLFFGPLMRLGGAFLISEIAENQRKLALGIDLTRCEPGSMAYVVSGADPSLCISGAPSLLYYRPELARRHPRLQVLSLAPHDQRVERVSDGAIVLHVDDLPRRSTIFEDLFRDTPVEVGMRVALDDLTATVLAAERGRPTRVRFELPANACLLWLEDKKLVGRPLPRLGETLLVPHELGPFGL
jgi:hypothetical protein